MELGRNVYQILMAVCLLMAVAQCLPAQNFFSGDDYPQGMREAIDEYELAGGQPGPIVPRGFWNSFASEQYPPMSRKSQRSSSQLRLRFGKRGGGFRGAYEPLSYIPYYLKGIKDHDESSGSSSGKTDK